MMGAWGLLCQFFTGDISQSSSLLLETETVQANTLLLASFILHANSLSPEHNSLKHVVYRNSCSICVGGKFQCIEITSTLPRPSLDCRRQSPDVFPDAHDMLLATQVILYRFTPPFYAGFACGAYTTLLALGAISAFFVAQENKNDTKREEEEMLPSARGIQEPPGNDVDTIDSNLKLLSPILKKQQTF
jgi:hypothetical protein